MKNTTKAKYSPSEEVMTFVMKVGKFHESLGMSRIGGQIMGLLLISENPLSHDDFQRILKVSRASVSSNLNLVIKSGAEEVHFPGDRKTYYKFSDYTGVKGYKLRKDINSYVIELLEDCMSAMKKDNLKTKNVEILKKSIIRENEVLQNLIMEIKK